MPETDINHIKLSPFVLASLYQDSLVMDIHPGELKSNEVPESIVEEAVPVQHPAWKSLGDNLKNTLIVVHNPGIPFLPDEELNFLTGILAACKLSLADVAILNIAEYPQSSYKEILRFFKSKIVLLFDVSPLDFGLPVSFPFYQIQPFAANSFLYSPSLKNLSNDKLEKSKLWVSLKRLFNL